METFSALLAFCAVNSPHKGQWRGALMFSLICVWMNGWVNSREAGDLRRHRDHYDVIVMGNTGKCWISVSRLNIKTVLPGMDIPITKMLRSSDRLIIIMGIYILVRRHIYVETTHGSSLKGEKTSFNFVKYQGRKMGFQSSSFALKFGTSGVNKPVI